jgi:hypothetical protein
MYIYQRLPVQLYGVRTVCKRSMERCTHELHHTTIDWFHKIVQLRRPMERDPTVISVAPLTSSRDHPG